MKSENLNSFNTLSNLVGKGKNLVVQSTRMDFETNTYISELWKRSNGEWKKFKSGDNITVYYKIKEGNKERIQFFKGDVLQRKGSGTTETFTIRKISNGIAVERIFPVNSPVIEKIEINKKGKVRRARIFYLRELTGKKARIKELKK